MADYVTPAELAAQLGLRDATSPRLARVCTAVSDGIDGELGRTDRFPDPVPAMIAEVALAYGVDTWKQPDAAFAVLGLNETGAVRAPRDLLARHLPQLEPFREPAGWGVA